MPEIFLTVEGETYRLDPDRSHTLGSGSDCDIRIATPVPGGVLLELRPGPDWVVRLVPARTVTVTASGATVTDGCVRVPASTVMCRLECDVAGFSVTVFLHGREQPQPTFERANDVLARARTAPRRWRSWARQRRAQRRNRPPVWVPGWTVRPFR